MKNEMHLIPPDLILSFEVSFTGCREKLADAVDRIMSLVQTLPCVQGRLEKLHLALMEALANAVIHGNREDPAKVVTVCAGCDRRAELLICVTDQGEGFDPSALPDPTAARNMHEGRGRGVFLMRRLVDEVEFNMGGRQVILRKRTATGKR
jgi:serine/threonine-protein kinase RsbW